MTDFKMMSARDAFAYMLSFSTNVKPSGEENNIGTAVSLPDGGYITFLDGKVHYTTIEKVHTNMYVLYPDNQKNTTRKLLDRRMILLYAPNLNSVRVLDSAERARNITAMSMEKIRKSRELLDNVHGIIDVTGYAEAKHLYYLSSQILQTVHKLYEAVDENSG